MPLPRCWLVVVGLTVSVAAATADPPPQPRAQRGTGPRAYKDRITPHWFAGGTKLWYRNDLKGGAKAFVRVDAVTGTKGPAFDHPKLAAALSKATEKKYPADRLPFDDIDYTADGRAVTFDAGGRAWRVDLTTYECVPAGAAKPKREEQPAETETEPEPSEAPFFAQAQPPGRAGPDRQREAPSPDGKWVAYVKDANVYVRPKDGDGVALSMTGTEKAPFGMLAWSPDGKAVVGFRIEPGEAKEVHLLSSSPPGGGRAVLQSRPYPLPGDRFTTYEPWVFDPAAKQPTKVAVETTDFGRPAIRWAKDRRHFTYEKVDRGHQRWRLIEVDAHTGATRTLIDEKSDTFIWTTHFENVRLPIVTWLPKSDEIIYATEKDGWRHLYLVDATTGAIKNPITRGDWVVRGIDKVDEDKRQVWFTACGRNAGEDPYLVHHYRLNLDGTGLVALTAGNGTHAVQFSPTREYLIDTHSRVDLPPVHTLRKAADGSLVCHLEEADIADLKADGWDAPEVFVAKGRDGKTDIWGVIARPKGFDPTKSYPVVEQIYAGPHGSHVPKAFSPVRRFSNLTDLGFIVVQIDGMGTANRSKAFHDVCWKNLKDAGFPDRILWHKAVAAKYPSYDISRVGVTGGSAGGQNAAGALLFHGDFYKAAVAGCGCHDNRMDKASWNEQWMGYPVGPQYAASSNIDHAHKLVGKLLLVVGEMDTNVPPESTYRLCDALIKAGKDFDFVLVPGGGHGMGGAYGQRRLQDFFVRHLMRTEPPDRNAGPPRKTQLVVATPPEAAPPPRRAAEPIDLGPLVARPANEAAAVTRRYDADRGSLSRAYPVPLSPTRVARMRKFHSDWLAALKAVDLGKTGPVAREELATLRSRVESDLKEVERRAASDLGITKLVSFADVIVGLDESRRRFEAVEPMKAAATLAELPKAITAAQSTAKSGGYDRRALSRAGTATDDLRSALKTWHGFFDGYDPLFSWWTAHPYKQADAALAAYSKFLDAQAEAAKDGPPAPTVALPPVLTGTSDAPDLNELLARKSSELVPVFEKYAGGDRGRFRGNAGSREDRDPVRWLDALGKLDFDKLSQDGRVDYHLLRTHLEREKRRQALRAKEGTRPTNPKDSTGIVGRPIGREALEVELAGEMIPYSPEELIVLAKREMAWCEAEMRKASREMGFGDDFRKAIEAVKLKYVPPGQQPELIRRLAVEAIGYVKAHDLVTVPPLAAETWRMEMMTPERQLFSPFFTGGEVISVAYPTQAMSHDAKMQSMRGNNPHFSRATVQHELIPGHHLQGYMTAREKAYRGFLNTPFWGEGWACYWEMVLYANKFAVTPEDRIGFMVWRTHRCARVIFSLSYHLGRMSPRECVDLLVSRVGFDEENALAEVRRSFAGGYGPLYQAGYLVGAMQFRRLRQDLVLGGAMTDRAFHDAILRENRIPVEMVRARLTGATLGKDFVPGWKFGGAGP